MLTLEPFSEDQGRSTVQPMEGIPPISFLAPYRFTLPLTRTCETPWSVFQDGPNGEPTSRCRERADAEARQGRTLPATIKAKESPQA
ncbi:hypothetical protein Vadar_011627 [Vaccinium darrowii]|nr:hypothetical protein Vadar_011627 [Vaccinium darrowii]